MYWRIRFPVLNTASSVICTCRVGIIKRLIIKEKKFEECLAH